MNANFKINSIRSVFPTYSWDDGVPMSNQISLTSICGPCECLDRYDLRWRWSERNSEASEQTTWLTTASASQYEKLWIECAGKYGLSWRWSERDSDCFQKHDLIWTWNETTSASEAGVSILSGQFTTWDTTKEGGELQKKWKFEPGSNESDLTTWTSTATGASWEKQWRELPIYTGYAPYVNISINSTTSNANASFSAASIRQIDFGDSYNSESNVVSQEGYSPVNFCHTYMMPGTYLITFSQTEYVTVNNFKKYKCLGKYEKDWRWDLYKSDCYQKHYMYWNWRATQNPTISGTYATWQNTAEYQSIQKKWAFEPTQEQLTWFDTATNQTLQKKWKFEPSIHDIITPTGEYYKQFGTNGFYNQEDTNESVLYDLTWQWRNMLSEGQDKLNRSVTWEDMALLGENQSTWENISAPCIDLETERGEIYWKWKSLSNLFFNGDPYNRTITWNDTNEEGFFKQTWNDAERSCDGTFPEMIDNNETYIGEFLINVLEIPPSAHVSVVETVSANGELSVRLTPKFTRCGSFPIDKIVWDLGDGSPLLVRRRWFDNEDNSSFVFTNNLSADVKDPRNFDVVHTYSSGSTNSNSTSYASLTAYASSTSTSDCCSVAITGIPIKDFATASENVALLQNYLNDDGSIVTVGQVDGKICVWEIQP